MRRKVNLHAGMMGGRCSISHIYNLLDELKTDTQKTYILVAHNGISRMVHSYFYEMTNEEFAGFEVKNCAVV